MTNNKPTPPKQTTITDSQIGVVGDHVYVEGGIHIGTSPSPVDLLPTYLDAVIQACQYIHLPATTGSDRPAIRLERVYVALKADRSSRAERRASHEFFRMLVEERLALRGGDLWRTVRETARLNPRAARFLRYDPRFAPLLAESAGREQDADATHYLAEIIRRHRWLILLGDPGSGKTTLARWLALQLAQAIKQERATVQVPADHVRPDADPEQTEELGQARLPLLVRIAHYTAARWPREQPGQDTRLSLLDYICSGRHLVGKMAQENNAAAWSALITRHIQDGRALFILDGLDEVTDTAHRHEVVAQIVQLIETHVQDPHGQTPLDPGYHVAQMLAPTPGDQPPFAEAEIGTGNQLIVTSRIVGYQVHPLPGELPHFVIQPMDDVAVDRFCQTWSAARGAPERAETLRQAILAHPNPRVRDEMARNPLLLTVLAQVFQASPGGQLPTRRAALYKEAVRAVFDQRQERWRQLAADLSSRDFVRVMTRLTAHVALRLHADPDFPASLAEEESVRDWLEEAMLEEPDLVKTRRVQDVIDDILAAARGLSGFFIARGQGVYGFVHRQFQEYFAAQALLASPDTTERFLTRLADPAWREVLLLGIALSGRRAGQKLLHAVLEAPDPTGGLLPHNLLFVAAALQELDRPPPDLIRQVATGLIHAYRRDDESRFAALHTRIERAFDALPRPSKGARQDPVGDALCAALQTDDTALDTAKLTRLAAAELIVKYKGYTPSVARALADAWQTYLEPAASLLATMQAAFDAHPEYFSGRSMRHFLPFRHAIEQEPDLWQIIETIPHWAALVRALYLAPGADLKPEAIVRDSALTGNLLPLLREPADDATLRAFLLMRFQENFASLAVPALEAQRDDPAEPSPQGRDAGLALAYLGETAIVSILAANFNDTRARAVIASVIFALDLDRALALDLNLARALVLARALARALDRALARVDEIVILIENIQTRAADQGLSQEIDHLLAAALNKAHRLKAHWGRGGQASRLSGQP